VKDHRTPSAELEEQRSSSRCVVSSLTLESLAYVCIRKRRSSPGLEEARSSKRR
jgi:hypothetical protein